MQAEAGSDVWKAVHMRILCVAVEVGGVVILDLDHPERVPCFRELQESYPELMDSSCRSLTDSLTLWITVPPPI